MASIEITNILTPAGVVIISGLGELELAASSVNDLSGQLDLEEVATSTDLQAAIDNSEVELRVNGALVTDVTQAPFPDSNAVDFMWSANRRGNVNVNGVDLRREGRTETNRAPFVTSVPVELVSVNATSRTTDNWTVSILTSPDFTPSSTWLQIFSGVVSGGASGALTPAFPTFIAANTYVRVRYERIGDNTLDPSVNLLLREGSL